MTAQIEVELRESIIRCANSTLIIATVQDNNNRELINVDFSVNQLLYHRKRLCIEILNCNTSDQRDYLISMFKEINSKISKYLNL